MLRGLGIAIVAVFLAAGVFELALALGAGSGAVKSGETPFGGDWIAAAAYLAVLLGAVLALAYTRWPADVVALFAPAATAFVVAFSFTYDSYYAPSLERYVHRDPETWKVLVAASILAVAVAVLTRFRRREGALATSVFLFLLFFEIIGIADGH